MALSGVRNGDATFFAMSSASGGSRAMIGAVSAEQAAEAFSRSLEAYEIAIGPTTHLVLSTNNELFRYVGAPR